MKFSVTSLPTTRTRNTRNPIKKIVSTNLQPNVMLFEILFNSDLGHYYYQIQLFTVGTYFISELLINNFNWYHKTNGLNFDPHKW